MSGQKSYSYAILKVLLAFSESLNIITDSQYAERVVLHIETAEFVPDNLELTLLFMQLHNIYFRNRNYPLYVAHIWSHTCLLGNEVINQLLIGNVSEASNFHEKHHVNSKS